MAYTSQADLVARFGADELAQIAPDGDGGIDATKVDGAIADTGAFVDGYVRDRYAVPLDPVPEVVTAVAADLARRRLYDDAPTPEVLERHKEAMALLRDIAAGRHRLAADPPATATGDAPTWSAPDRSFTDDGLSSL